MQKQTVAFSKNSSNLFFHILTKCNLSCRHCYINPEQHGKNTLSIDTIKEWLYLFSKFTKTQFTNNHQNIQNIEHIKDVSKCEDINVIFLGGEPTLHPDLAVAVKEARTLNFKSITIDTNGYLFHNILEKISPDDVDFISFSLDGASEKTNDFIRGKGSYKTVLNGIKQSVDSGFSTSMIYTVSSDNLHELSMMPDLIKWFGIKRFFIQVIGIRGSSTEQIKYGIGINHRQVSKREWLESVPKVAQTIAEQGIIVTYPKVFLEEGEKFECAGLVADNYFIFPNGRVYRCPICEDYPIHSFEITTQDVATGQDVSEEQNNVKKQDVATKQYVILPTKKINESDLFKLDIIEGCVMNKLIQPGNLAYNPDGTPCYKIACCMLKEEVRKY